MTGFYPTNHGVRLNGTTALSQSQTTLAEVFAGRGYETAAFIAAGFSQDSARALSYTASLAQHSGARLS
jgi:arylsulfatase A-like enzyme